VIPVRLVVDHAGLSHIAATATQSIMMLSVQPSHGLHGWLGTGVLTHAPETVDVLAPALATEPLGHFVVRRHSADIMVVITDMTANTLYAALVDDDTVALVAGADGHVDPTARYHG
jgi:hypothetical protein